MLGPVSRFPLGLLDLFGVKQMGAYPGEVAQNFQPTLDLLRLVAQANSTDTGIDLPINLFDVATLPAGTYPVAESVGGPQLATAQNECMFITGWNIQMTVNGVGGAVPDCTLCYDIDGGHRISFSSFIRGGFTAGGLATTISWLKGDADCLIYVPPGAKINLATWGQATSVLGGDCRIATCLRFIKMRV